MICLPKLKAFDHFCPLLKNHHIAMLAKKISLISLEEELTSSELLQNSHSSDIWQKLNQSSERLASLGKCSLRQVLRMSLCVSTMDFKYFTVKHLSHPPKKKQWKHLPNKSLSSMSTHAIANMEGLLEGLQGNFPLVGGFPHLPGRKLQGEVIQLCVF